MPAGRGEWAWLWKAAFIVRALASYLALSQLVLRLLWSLLLLRRSGGTFDFVDVIVFLDLLIILEKRKGKGYTSDGGLEEERSLRLGEKS